MLIGNKTEHGGKQCNLFTFLIWEKYEERKPKASSIGTKSEPLKLLLCEICEPAMYMSRTEVCGMTILCIWENGNNTH